MKSSFAASVSFDDSEEMTQTRESSVDIQDSKELKRDLKQLQLTNFFAISRSSARRPKNTSARSEVSSLCSAFERMAVKESSSDVIKFINRSLLATQEATLFTAEDVARIVKKLNGIQGKESFKASHISCPASKDPAIVVRCKFCPVKIYFGQIGPTSSNE
jgi:DNA topoisomerase VI subunit B